MSGNKNPIFGTPRSIETKRKIKETLLRKYSSSEIIRKKYKND